MRRALVSLLLVAACTASPVASVPSPAPSLVAPSTVEPTATPVAAAPAPDRSTEPTSSPVSPTASPLPYARAPFVRVERPAFAIGALPPARVSSLADLPEQDRQMIGDLRWWLETYAEAFALPRPSKESGDPLATLTSEGAVRDVMRAWFGDPGVATRTFADRQIAIERVHLKPWGRIAFVEVAVSYVDRVTTAGRTYEERRQHRFRLADAPRFFIADVYDPTARAWLIGDAPRYSALQLEAEVADAVGRVLVEETFVEGGDVNTFVGPGPQTPLRRARKAERDVLVADFQKGAFLARRVEDVTARITRFDPATTTGEGVVAVGVAARIVTVGPDRTERSHNVTREYRFLRLAQLGTWQLIDDRRADGQWLSGGELALYDLDGRFG